MNNEIKYKIVDGTSYHAETDNKIVDILENCRRNRTRIVLDYGDTKTGQSWGETFDNKGRLGRSMGPTKVPILLHNARSMGGGAILDHCIVKITESKGGRVLYQHPTYKPANHEQQG